MIEELRQENETLRKQVLELSAQVEKMREALEYERSLYLEADSDIGSLGENALTIEPSAALQSYVDEEVAKELVAAAYGLETIDDGDQPAYRHCQEYLQDLAAERRNRK